MLLMKNDNNELLNAKMRTSKVKNIKKENYRIKTIEINAGIDAKPGQFIMVWVPGVGERPFSITSNQPLTLVIADVGPVSNALCSMKPGDLFTFRGPLGNAFQINKKNKKVLLVGGGYGVAPVYFLASKIRKQMKKKKSDITVILAVRNEKDIIYWQKFKRIGCKTVVSTDDGTKGFKGNAVECVKEQFKKKNFDCIYACGPEKMMYPLALFCKENKIPCQLSLERYMKCGLGICGSCALDGVFVCRDGPVFSSNDALAFKEFGYLIRDGSGRAKEI